MKVLSIDLNRCKGVCMVRISYPQLNGSPKIAQSSSQIIKKRAKLHNLYKMLLNSLPVAQGWPNFLNLTLQKFVLSGKIRELSILQIPVINKADYEFKIHMPFGLKEGLIRGSNYAWSNRSNQPAVVVVATHDAMDIK